MRPGAQSAARRMGGRGVASFGDELIQSAREALEIAQGKATPAFVHVPDEVDVAAIRKRKNMSQERFTRAMA